jgi:hypothetical protein
MRLLIALVVWVGAIVAAIVVSSAVATSIHNGSPSASTNPSSVTSTHAESLFRTANMEKALSVARGKLGSNVTIDDFALYPGYLALTGVDGNNEVDLYVDVNGRSTKTVSSGTSSDVGFPLTKIDAAAPAGIAQAIATKADVPQSKLHYMVAESDPISHKFHWLVYTLPGTGVEYFQISGPHGRLLEYKTNSSTGLQPVR